MQNSCLLLKLHHTSNHKSKDISYICQIAKDTALVGLGTQITDLKLTVNSNIIKLRIYHASGYTAIFKANSQGKLSIINKKKGYGMLFENTIS